MSIAKEWLEIMAGLRGRRLAVLDELTSGLVPNCKDLRVQEAVGWLVYNQFVRVEECAEGGGILHARDVLEARKLWMEQGPAREQAGRLFSHVAAPTPLPAAAESEEHGAKGKAQAEPVRQAQGEPAAGSVHARRPSQPELFG